MFTPDGLFGFTDRNRAYFCDPTTGREVRSVPTGDPSILSPAGDTLVRIKRGMGGPALLLCDARTGEQLHRIESGVGPYGFAYSPDGKLLAVLAVPNAVHLWDVAARKSVAELTAPADTRIEGPGEGDVGFTADGRTLFVRLASGDLARLDVRTRRELSRLRTGSWPPLGGLHNLPDGKGVLTPSYRDGLIRVWDSDTGAEVPVPGRYRYLLSLALSPDGKTVAMGDDTGRIDLLDATSGRLDRVLQSGGEAVRQHVFGPVGRFIAVTEGAITRQQIGPMPTARVLRVADGAEVRAFGPYEDNVDPLGFTPESRELVFIQGQVTVGDVATGRVVRGVGPVPRPGARPLSAALSPDGQRVAVAEKEVTTLWDVATGKEPWRAEARKRDVNPTWAFDGARVAWSADGKTLICGRPSDLVLIHDTETGREKRRFTSSPGGIPPRLDFVRKEARLFTRAVALSPDGKRAATVGWLGTTVHIWDVANGGVIAELKHPFGVGAVVFTSDGKGLIATGAVASGVAYRWDVEAAIAGYEG